MEQNQPKGSGEPNQDNPALSKVIERNIRTIIHLRAEAAHQRGLQDQIADAITSFSGRMIFAYVHIVWFGAWILINTGHFGIPVFDPFPYGLLTMIVSLEAIFLSTFVLISQNRLAQETERRADLDLHIGLLTEHELSRVLQMLDVYKTSWGSWIMRTAIWQTWKPSRRMYWRKFTVSNSVNTTIGNHYE